MNRLNHGLTYTSNCLPANVPVVIRLHRAPTAFALIKLADSVDAVVKSDQSKTVIPYSFTESVIPIKNPILEAFYAYSPQIESAMSKSSIYDYTLDFFDYQARRTVLDSGLSDYQLTLQIGKFPKYMLLMLSTLDRLGGSETLSLTKFSQNDLNTLDILVDQESLLGYPITGDGYAGIDFYQEPVMFLSCPNKTVFSLKNTIEYLNF